ncbi:probable GDP-L-fucose synthase [Uranotaenia lowii]|uniref:probable GDP-L-fucose synthase n=1 Tax=Uranotaenia lowii TaxID=190385 RepID=UPI00247A355A|nr:probable GDP-L-fucose synthase [Uranotaenia lowii]
MAKVVLVTGGTGLVGKAIETVIKEEQPVDEEWIFVGTKDADLTNLESARALFDRTRPTHVIHLAAMVGGLYDHLQKNLSYLRSNIYINDHVLLLSHEHKVQKVVSCLSSCIFPDKTSYPIDETMIHNGPPHDSNFGYGYAKRLIDITNRAYHLQYGSMFTSVVPCNIFGPHDNFHPNHSHAVPGLIQRMHATINFDQSDKSPEDKVFTVMGTGKPLRQFIYSIDLAKLIIWVLRNYDSIEPISLIPDESEEITIAQLAESIARAFEFKGRIEFDTSKSDGQHKKTASNAKLRRLYPDFRFTDFDIAIQQTVQWYQNNYEIARK